MKTGISTEKQNSEVKIKTLKTKTEKLKISIKKQSGEVEIKKVKNKNGKVKNRNEITMWPPWASLDFAQEEKSRGGTVVTRAYIKESTYS